MFIKVVTEALFVLVALYGKEIFPLLVNVPDISRFPFNVPFQLLVTVMFEADFIE